MKTKNNYSNKADLKKAIEEDKKYESDSKKKNKIKNRQKPSPKHI